MQVEADIMEPRHSITLPCGCFLVKALDFVSAAFDHIVDMSVLVDSIKGKTHQIVSLGNISIK
jgi:hypothetical protein